MRLVGVELRRVLARRMVAAIVAGGVLAVALVLVSTWMQARPLTDAQVDQAEQAYAMAVEDFEEHGEEMLASCREAEADESERTGEDVDFLCDQMEPQREMFFPQRAELHLTLPGQLAGVAVLLTFLTFLVGVTSTAAEVSTGSLGTWLTFVPRRSVVLASKVTAGTVVALPVVAGLLALLVAGSFLVHDARGLADGMTTTAWADALWTGARILALGALAGALGAALGLLLRHTAAALGAVVAYALVVESIVAGMLPELQPWLLRTNMAAWVQDGSVYWRNQCTVTSSGTTCTTVEELVTLGHGALYLAVVGAVLLAVTTLVFRRRDVV